MKLITIILAFLPCLSIGQVNQYDSLGNKHGSWIDYDLYDVNGKGEGIKSNLFYYHGKLNGYQYYFNKNKAIVRTFQVSYGKPFHITERSIFTERIIYDEYFDTLTNQLTKTYYDSTERSFRLIRINGNTGEMSITLDKSVITDDSCFSEEFQVKDFENHLFFILTSNNSDSTILCVPYKNMLSVYCISIVHDHILYQKTTPDGKMKTIYKFQFKLTENNIYECYDTYNNGKMSFQLLRFCDKLDKYWFKILEVDDGIKLW